MYDDFIYLGSNKYSGKDKNDGNEYTMYDDFIYLGSNKYSGKDKNDGHVYTMYKIAFAVIPPDSYYEGYECAAASVSEEIYYKLSKLMPLEHFKGIVVRDPRKGLTIYRLA